MKKEMLVERLAELENELVSLEQRKQRAIHSNNLRRKEIAGILRIDIIRVKIEQEEIKEQLK